MTQFAGFRLRGGSNRTNHNGELPAAYSSQEAQARVISKIRALGEGFYQMPEEQYGRWLDKLPLDEFVEFLALATDDSGEK